MPTDFATNNVLLHQLTQTYRQQVLFTDVNRDLNNGDMLLILGSNGSGKSTLLRLLTGLQEPTHGTITWNGNNIANNQEYQAGLHYIGHQTGLRPALTVLENIQLLFLLHSMSIPLNHRDTLQALALHNLLHVPVRQLSAGQQRRVALTKLFLIAKPIWLLDEPLTALDQTTQLLVQQAINQHREKGGMVIVSSHQELAHIKTSYHELRLTS